MMKKVILSKQPNKQLSTLEYLALQTRKQGMMILTSA
jgi:hypothetical protein